MTKTTLTKDKTIQPLIKKSSGVELLVEQAILADFPMMSGLQYKLGGCPQDLLDIKDMLPAESAKFNTAFGLIADIIKSYEARR